MYAEINQLVYHSNVYYIFELQKKKKEAFLDHESFSFVLYVLKL